MIELYFNRRTGVLIDTLFVTDINECDVMPGLCEGGMCVNTDGSFTCKCPKGYRHERSTHQCIGTYAKKCIKQKLVAKFDKLETKIYCKKPALKLKYFACHLHLLHLQNTGICISKLRKRKRKDDPE